MAYSGRHQCKVRECVTCFRINPKSANQLMGNLPKVRIALSPPFFNTGVDYAGPLLIKDKKTRGYKLHKAYLCLFICLSTKSVHLEVVSELTSEAFIATLRRFFARRGCPRNLYSDNGSNFVGVAREMKELFNQLNSWHNCVSKFLSKDMITWHFIPARTPNFGGIWESNIKSMKRHLFRIIDKAKLTYEELSTVLAQIESILNSRPLTPVSDNPEDLEALTPAHFLIGRPLTSIPDSNLNDVKLSHLSRFQYLQHLQQQYWCRWSKEYISGLQQRFKWQQEHSLNIGSLVILKDDNLPPLLWRLGRVTTLRPGNDGLVRVVVIKTKFGDVTRGVSKVCVLPFKGN